MIADQTSKTSFGQAALRMAASALASLKSLKPGQSAEADKPRFTIPKEPASWGCE